MSSLIKNKKKLFLSIIMPTYNSAKYIEEAIKSVLNQSYKNFELIIVDDCSTDNTYNLIKLIKKKDKRVKYLKTKKNSKTASIPRNLGIRAAKGEIIGLIDSDDYWHPDKLKLQLNNFKKGDYLSCSASNYVKKKKKSNFIINYFRIFLQIFIFSQLKKNRYYWLYVYNPVILSSVLLRKKIFSSLLFSENENIREDLYFWFRLFPLIKKNFFFEKKILCTITRVKGSLSFGTKKEFNKIINSISNHFISKNKYDKFHFFIIGIFLRVFKVLVSIIYIKFKPKIIKILSILIFVYIIIFYSPFYYQLGKKLSYINDITETDAIVLISGHDEIKYQNKSWQVRYYDFLKLDKEFNNNPKVFLLGRNQLIPETKILKSLILDYGVNKENVIELLDARSTTKDNIFYIFETLKKYNLSNVTIVTSPYHTLRTKLLWQKYNFDIDAYFYSDKLKKYKIFSKSINKKVINYELLALLYNKLRGWI